MMYISAPVKSFATSLHAVTKYVICEKARLVEPRDVSWVFSLVEQEMDVNRYIYNNENYHSFKVRVCLFVFFAFNIECCSK